MTVGSYTLNGRDYGFICDEGVYQSIDIPEASSLVVRDINNDGVIVGSYVDSVNGNTYGFIGTPVPEPLTFDLLSMGAFCMSRRRKSNF